MIRVIVNYFLPVLILHSSNIAFADPCRFELSGKGVIDLSSVGFSNGSSAFPESDPGPFSSFIYSYNPCYAFTDGDDCKNVAICQESRNKAYKFALGTQESAVWSAGDGTGDPVILYNYQTKNVSLTLHCLESGTPSLQAFGEGPVEFYKLQLNHKCACWNACKGSGSGSKGGVSGGLIFVIILLAVAVIYFVGFAVFYRIRTNNRGLALIPHRAFWSATMSNARSGCVFVFRKITCRTGQYTPI